MLVLAWGLGRNGAWPGVVVCLVAGIGAFLAPLLGRARLSDSAAAADLFGITAGASTAVIGLLVLLAPGQFGGSLYSMCDPFFMLMLMMQLGQGYVVWDKSASIEFLRPGRGRVKARFELPRDHVEQLRAETDDKGKINPEFEVTVVDEKGESVARVHKVLSVRRKDAGRAAA